MNGWSILFAYDIHPNDAIATQINTAYVDSIPQRLNLNHKTLCHPPIFYIQSKWLIHFCQAVLPLINQLFLVSGDNDTAINMATLGNALSLILYHPHSCGGTPKTKFITPPS